MIKRTFDILISAALLLLLSPILLLLILLVALCDGRPVLFAQERMGRGGRPFRLLKFRTMRPGAGPRITAGDDERRTRLGRYLRRTRLDELPQLVHVLLGTMSLVGPRPELPSFIDLDNPDQRVVLSVRPGLIDPAVLAYLDEEEMLAGKSDVESWYAEHILPQKLTASAAYLRHAGFWSDLCLLGTAAGRLLLRFVR